MGVVMIDERQDQLENVLSSTEQEASLLGTVLMNGALMPRFAWLKPEDFFDPVYAEIWRIALDVHKDGGAISPVTLALRLKVTLGEDANEILATVAGAQNSTAQAPHYAKQIRALSVRRAVASMFGQGSEAVADLERPIDEVIAETIGDLTRLSGEGARQSITKRQVAHALVESLKEDLPCYSTGLPGLDRAMGGGAFAGKLYGFAARKKVGKTILLGTVSHNLNMAGVKHLFVPFEMSPAEIEQRNAARACEFNSVKFLTRDWPDMGKRLANYAVNVPDNTIYEYHPGATLDDIRAMAARHIVKNNIKGLVVDYWQLVGGKAPRETEEYHLRMVAQTLADIARREGLFVLTAAQVNQDGNTRGGEGLKLACDQYYTLHREKDQQGAWLQMEESRYTLYQNVGNDVCPGLMMNKNGPHFEDTQPQLGAA